MNLTDEKVLGAASGRDSDAPVARPAMQCHDGQEPAGGPGVGRGRREEAAVPVLKRQDGRDGQHLRRQIRGLQPEKLHHHLATATATTTTTTTTATANTELRQRKAIKHSIE